MKAKVEKIVRKPCELEISGATLLSVDEAEQLLTEKDRTCKSWWWLRSPGYLRNNAASVNQSGAIYAFGLFVDLDIGGVRPVLKIENLASSNLKIGDTFCFGGEQFKIISVHLALCETIIGLSRFDKSSNDYERSEIKAFVDAWFANAIKGGSDA